MLEKKNYGWEVYRDECRDEHCTCHDDTAWKLDELGGPATYTEGCKQCWCGWIFIESQD